MSNENVVKNLKVLLADSYMLMLKTHNYHWNVTGPQFHAVHGLFEGQYTELFEAVDEVAERIRMLGEKTPGTFKAYAEVTSIKDGNENASMADMLKEILADQSKLVASAKAVLEAAQEAGDEVSADLAIQRMASHEKTVWMMKSSM